jgi:hypothetical protein
MDLSRSPVGTRRHSTSPGRLRRLRKDRESRGLELEHLEARVLLSGAFSINDISHQEGDSGTSNAVFTVTRSGSVGDPASVDWATSDGTATAGSDYTSGSGTLSFAANETSKTISVSIAGDTTLEANETFYVNLTNPTLCYQPDHERMKG